MYSCFIFSTKSSKTSCENIYLNGDTTFGYKCITKCFNQVFSASWIGRWFLTTKRVRSCKNYFCCTHFLKGSFAPKNSNISKLNTLGPFFVGCLSNTFLNGEFISSSNFFVSTTWSTSTCFKKVVKPFLIKCYNSSHFFCSWIKKDKINISNHTTHDLRFSSINNVFVVYNIKWQTQCILIMNFPFFSLDMQFLYIYFIFPPLLSMAMDYVCKLIFFSMVLIQGVSSIKTWSRKISQNSFSTLVSFSFVLEYSILQWLFQTLWL